MHPCVVAHLYDRVDRSALFIVLVVVLQVLGGDVAGTVQESDEGSKVGGIQIHQMGG